MQQSLVRRSAGPPAGQTALHNCNATSIIKNADAGLLEKLRKTTFWVASAAKDAGFGNRDRALAFVKILKTQAIRTGFKNIIFDGNAAHTWHWTDRFLVDFSAKALVRQE